MSYTNPCFPSYMIMMRRICYNYSCYTDHAYSYEYKYHKLASGTQIIFFEDFYLASRRGYQY